MSFRSLGVIGATGNTQIEREQITLDQILTRKGATLKLSVDDFDKSRLPSGSSVDILIKDNQNHKRTYHSVGDIRHVDFSDINQPLERALDAQRSEIFIKVVDPDGRIAAQSECVKLSGGDSGLDGNGNKSKSRSPIHTVIDPKQEIPVMARVESEFPLISFSTQHIKSNAEAKNDFGCVAYALRLAVEKFILAMVLPGGDELASEYWNGFRKTIAMTLGKPDWETVVRDNSSPTPIEVADSIAEQYYKRGELKKIVDRILTNKAIAEENEE